MYRIRVHRLTYSKVEVDDIDIEKLEGQKERFVARPDNPKSPKQRRMRNGTWSFEQMVEIEFEDMISKCSDSSTQNECLVPP